jgi:creatinine amidohydrolase
MGIPPARRIGGGMEEILLERMSWRAIAQRIATGWNRVLVMVGSIEQHGPHLPVGTDTILGYAWGEAIARKLGRMLVAPVIRPGLSFHHKGFAGTITLDEALLLTLLEQTCASLADSGFQYIFLLCSHGGNWPVVHQGLARLRMAAPTARVLTLPPEVVEYIEEQIYAFLSSRGISRAVAGIHAGLRETAYMMWLAGNLVDRDAITCGLVDEAVLAQLRKGLKLSELTPTGVLGDPRGATQELGKELNELTVSLYVEAIRRELARETC